MNLLFLLSNMSFTCKVVPADSMFLRRLLDLCLLQHRSRIDAYARFDLSWFHD